MTVSGDLPQPLTPADCDLQDFEFMPVMVRRLLKSDTWSLGTGDERAAAVALWFESWHQVPAGSLPSDDRLLKRLADSERWAKVKGQALRGWVLCSDGRLYHPVVAEKALESWIEKLLAGIAGASGNAKRWGLTIDTAAGMQQLQAAIAMLRVLDPQSRTLKKKAVMAAAAGIAPGSPPDPKAPSPPDAQVASPPDSGVDRNRQGQGQGIDTSGEGGAAAKIKSPEELAKAELWRAAVSLFTGQGMPEPQARQFFGKLAKDHPDGSTVTDALRNCIAEQPADARAWLTAECQRLTGTRKPQPRRATSHTGLADKNYTEGITADGTLA